MRQHFRCYLFSQMHLFERVGEAKHLLLVEMITKKSADPPGARLLSTRRGRLHAGNTGEAAGGKVVCKYHGEIHLHRIVTFFADPKCRKRRNRRNDRIHGLKCSGEIAGDQRAHFLRFLVLSIVVAMAEHVGAQHDAEASPRGRNPPRGYCGTCRSASRNSPIGDRSARHRNAQGSNSLRPCR